jgi:hypothetical protein
MGPKRSKSSNVYDSSSEQGRIGSGSRGGEFSVFDFLPQDVAFNYTPHNLNFNVGSGSPLLSGWEGIPGIEPLQNLPANFPQPQQGHNQAENMDQFIEQDYVYVTDDLTTDFDFQHPQLSTNFDAEEPQPSRLPLQSSSDSANSTEPEDQNNSGDGARPHNGRVQRSATDAESSGRSLIRKQRPRGPFQTEEDRKETSQNRKDRVCLRCRMQHIRVSFDLGFSSLISSFPIY